MGLYAALATWALGGAPLGAAAQTGRSGLEVSQLPDAFVHESWTVKDGLPVNSIHRVLQGRKGYLWLATWDGLVRFDGARFTVFSTGSSEGLPSNRIVELDDGADGSLWMRTEQNHLVRLREGDFTHFGAAHGLQDRSTRVLYPDAEGGVWIGTDQGVRHLQGERFLPVAEQAIRGEVTAMMRDAAGALWVGTRHEGLYRVHDGQVTHYDTAAGLTSNTVAALLQDRPGAVWIGTAAGVHRYRSGGIERVVRDSGRPLEQHITDLRVAPSSGEIWVMSVQGIYVVREGRLHPVVETPGQASIPVVRFHPSGATWYAVGDRLYRDGRVVFQIPLSDPAEQPSITQIQDFTWDHEGSLWIGTYNSGLYRLKPSLFGVYSAAEGVADRNVAVVLEDRAGALWIGTMGRGLSRLAGGRVTSYTPDQGFPPWILALLQDRQGDLWAGSWDRGILYCRLPAVSCGAPPGGQPAPGAMVRALHQDRAGEVWAGTDRGLFRLRNGLWERMARGEGLESSVVRVFLEAPDGTLWMGTNGSGVLAYREGRFSRISAADGLPSDLIRSLYVDARGRLWAGTEGRGLARITPAAGPAGEVAASAIRTVRQRDGLFDEVIHQILDDGAGRLWMSTNRGIFWVSLAELNDFADGRISRIHSTAYSERDGLRNREANGGNHPAGIRARDGRLWFATQDGAVVVDPANTRRNEVPPPVLIEQVATRKRTLRPDARRLTLEAGERDFEIDYTALSFMAPENVRFRYRLEGLTTEWTEAGNRRTAFYTNVPPGRYTFRVIASNNDEVWNETGASLELQLAPHLWETGAFRLLALLLLGVLLAGGVGWRNRNLRARTRELARLVEERTRELRQHEAQLKEQNSQLAELDQAKSRFFANVSHEFRTPLTLILGPLRDLAEERQGTLPDRVRGQLDMMMRNAQRLLRLVNQVLDLARLESGALTLSTEPRDLVELARAATLSFIPLAERRSIALRFHSGAQPLLVQLDADQMEKVLLNLLSNAFKFTEPGGEVEVTLHAQDADAVLLVRDTGIGIAPEKLPHVFERFYQADSSATRRYEGTGIGLSLVRELVELHGGTVSAESQPGRGSTFRVRLPLLSPHPPTSLPTRREPFGLPPPRGEEEHTRVAVFSVFSPPPESGERPGEGAREPAEEESDRTTVLVVDDHADIRSYVRSVLEPTYSVLEAGDGQEGLERAREALPDVVIADVMMPRLDGFGLARALREEPATDCIPLILLTARAGEQAEIEGLGTGADDYLAKPFHAGVLEARVGNLIASRRRLRERFRQEGLPAPAVPTAPARVRSELEARLRRIIEANLTDPDFNPEALAAAAGLSYQQLYRQLATELGAAPSHFLRTVRVEHAARLLREGTGSVTEVAYSVGFHSLSYFHRCYRERFGTTPLASARTSG